jgi:hypothetical protein
MLLALAPAFAQVTGAVIVGIVTDAGGAAAPNVEVTVTNTGTGVATAARTNASGFYETPALLPGVYNLSAKAAGFSSYSHRDIRLTVAQRLSVDFSLQLASVQTSIEVSGMTDVVQTETAGTAHVAYSCQSDHSFLGKPITDLWWKPDRGIGA